MYQGVVSFIQSTFQTTEFLALHEPRFIGNEKKYLNECIDSTFVSSVGKFVDRFEQDIAAYTGAKYAVATVNGTAALHVSLVLCGVEGGDEVITQPLTFVATCNAISYCGAKPIFVDVDKDTLGMSPDALRTFLEENTELKSGMCFNKASGKFIKACVPMHTFGHACRIDEIKTVCETFGLKLIEDAAESLGSYYKNQHTGTFADIGAFSFNGNKIITSGGGGCIVTNNKALAERAKYITTTAKVPHKWEFEHDMIAYNYRMPNLNAALLVAQMEQVSAFVANKRELAAKYENFFANNGMKFVQEPKYCKSNYWLNALILESQKQRDEFLEYTNAQGVMTRPIWKLMTELEMFKDAQMGSLENAEWLVDRVVNIPSSVRV